MRFPMSKDQENSIDFQLLLKDLAVLSTQSCEIVAGIAEDLANTRFATDLQGSVRRHLASDEEAEAIGRLIAGLDVTSIPVIEAALQASLESSQGGKAMFTINSVKACLDHLALLITPETSTLVERTKKAVSLSTATGNDLSNLSFVCDVRPVYGESHATMDGYVPLITMKIEFKCPNQKKDVIELTMIPSTLEALIQMAKEARQDVLKIQAAFSKWLPSATEENNI
jgi:hypothetical protein